MIYSKKEILEAVDPFLDLIDNDAVPIDEWYSVGGYLDLHIDSDEETGAVCVYVYAVKWDVNKHYGSTDTSREMCVYNSGGEIPEPRWEGLVE